MDLCNNRKKKHKTGRAAEWKLCQAGGIRGLGDSWSSIPTASYLLTADRGLEVGLTATTDFFFFFLCTFGSYLCARTDGSFLITTPPEGSLKSFNRMEHLRGVQLVIGALIHSDSATSM